MRVLRGLRAQKLTKGTQHEEARICNRARRAGVCAEIFTEPVGSSRDKNHIPYCGKVVCASIAATNSAAFNLGVAHAFTFGTNSVFATNTVYTGTAAKGVTNVVLSAPVYVKPGDRWVCYGAGASNGSAKAEVFIER